VTAVPPPEPGEFEAVIGLEVHVQLLTRTKMFCGCSATYLGLPPNSNTCPVCLGLPGTLPVINREAVALTLRTALALQCEIPTFSKFDRKNYFYPDLPKGYQISQFDLPLSQHGWLEFEVDGVERAAGITRVHLEEDAGKLLHEGELHSADHSLVDLNRAGVPLMEVVGEPDLRSPAEARAYVTALRQLLVYIGVTDGNMEEGSLRCDANVSLRPPGSQALGVKVEVKNMNSFRSVQRALEFEIERQTVLLRAGAPVEQATRGWSEPEGRTVPQRSKEEAEDYRYFPEPDLPPLVIAREQVEAIRAALPELPRARWLRLQQDYAVSAADAHLLSARAPEADYFEAVVAAGAAPKLAATWQLNELAGLCQRRHRSLEACGLAPERLAALLRLVAAGTINGGTAKELLAEAIETGADPAELAAERQVGQVSDPTALTAIVEEVLQAQAKAARDFQTGNDRALGALIGGVMARTRGLANPQLVDSLLRERLPRDPGP